MVGGSGEIRTHGGVAPTAVFKTAALNRSATLPLNARILGCFGGCLERPGVWNCRPRPLPALTPNALSMNATKIILITVAFFHRA